MARTNACARQGFEVAIERAQMFADADADADRAAWAKARLGAAAGRRGAMPLRLGGGRHEPSWPIENARRRRADPAQFALPIEKSGLAPARVEEMADLTAEEPLKEGESANTVAAYRAAMRYWAAWFAERFGMQIALPVSPAAVRTFITDHAQGKAGNGLNSGLSGALVSELPPEIDARLVAAGFKGKLGPFKLSTLLHRVSALSKSHQLAHAPNPCADAGVRLLLSRTRSAYAKRGQRVTKQTALTRELLQQLLDSCDDSLRGVRDRALLSFAWATGGGGARRSKVPSSRTSSA